MDKPSTKHSSARDDRHHKDRNRDSDEDYHRSSRDDRHRHHHRHREHDPEEHRRSSRHREKSEEGGERSYGPPHEERESRREKRKERERSGRVTEEDGDRKERRRRFVDENGKDEEREEDTKKKKEKRRRFEDEENVDLKDVDVRVEVKEESNGGVITADNVNINKQKKDAFQILKPELDVDPETNPHFDALMGMNKSKLLRQKRMTFQFVKEGKWSKEAEILKLKSQFGEARAKEQKAKQAQLAKAKAAPDINPNLIEVSERIITKEKPKEIIPEAEWWTFLFSKMVLMAKGLPVPSLMIN